LVPPAPGPASSHTEWVKVDGRGRRINSDDVMFSARQRASDRKNSTPKSSKRLIKPAVVTITSKTGGATYAEILAKAREKVSLRDLGIQSTVIRQEQ